MDERERERWRSAFALEVAAAERLRAAILALLAVAVALLGATVMLLFPDLYDGVFPSGEPYRVLAGYGVLLGLYEGAITTVIRIRLARGKAVPEPARYVNATVEITGVTVLMLLLADSIDALAVFLGPVSLLYGVFIVLSVLRLSPALSIYTGVLAALQYAAGALLVAADADPAEGAVAMPVYHGGRAAFLGVTGLASGFVAAQIRRQVVRLVQGMEERGRLLMLFGQQVSEPIARELTERPDGPVSQRRHVAVMFLDIRDFSSFASQRTPEDVVRYQNAVFGFMLETIARHHGIVNQLLGDGFMATFGAPVAVGNSSANAVAAAREMLEGLTQRIGDGRIPPTRVGIGIHAGEAIVGNVGNAVRKQYSVTGTVVIVASRIETLNKELGSTLLVSGLVMEELGGQQPGAEAIGPVTLRGQESPITLFRLA